MPEVEVPDAGAASLDVTKIASESHMTKCQNHTGLRQEAELSIKIAAAIR
jgi:hypothetical protein